MTPSTPVPVAIVMSSFDAGGTERQMIELATGLDPSRWAVHVVSLRAGGRWLHRLSGIPHALFPVTSFRRRELLDEMRAFARWCIEKRIAIAQTTDMPSNLFGLPAACLARVPVRIGARREIAWRTRGELGAQRAAYAFAHTVVANSAAAADQLRIERVPSRKVEVIHNGLDADRFAAKSVTLPLRRVLMVANLRREKGHDVLIAAARGVLARFPDAQFDIIGDGVERDAIIAHANAAGVAHRFSFAGHCEDVASRLASGDIFVLPSRSEAFPNSVLEAMAAGLPVVASAVGGILEIVDDGRNGLLVPPDDPDRLADRLCLLMSDPELAIRLGTAARNSVGARFSFDRMVRSFERVYADQLVRRGSRRSADRSNIAASL